MPPPSATSMINPNFRALIKASYTLAGAQQQQQQRQHQQHYDTSSAANGLAPTDVRGVEGGGGGGGGGFIQLKTDAEIDLLIIKYRGHEEELFKTLCAKYSLDPNAVLAAVMASNYYLKGGGGLEGTAAAAAGSRGGVGGAADDNYNSFVTVAASSHDDSSSAGTTPYTNANPYINNNLSMMNESGPAFPQQPQFIQQQQYHSSNNGGITNNNTTNNTAMSFAQQQFEFMRRIEMAKSRLTEQQRAITTLVSDRAEQVRDNTATQGAQKDELSIITHTLTALKIDLLRLESKLLPKHVPLSEYTAVVDENRALTARLGEVLKLRKMLEKAVGEHITLYPNSSVKRTAMNLDPAMAVRLGAM